jgi:ribosome-associated translation inhibitor RaiA
MTQFPTSISRPEKRNAGATALPQTPVSIRTSRVTLSKGLEEHVRTRLASKLGKVAHHIERISVRFEDINGPKGGVDIICQVRVVLSGMPSVMVHGHGENDRVAFASIVDPLTRAVRSTLDRNPTKPRRASANAGGARPPARRTSSNEEQSPSVDPGSYFGRRVGRGQKNLKQLLDKPDRARRDQTVDTSLPGVSATDRKAGGNSTARRNVMARAPRATATLEDSRQARPSRKSTRKSANRTKSGTNLQKRAAADARSPKRQATRAQAR